MTDDKNKNKGSAKKSSSSQPKNKPKPNAKASAKDDSKAKSENIKPDSGAPDKNPQSKDGKSDASKPKAANASASSNLLDYARSNSRLGAYIALLSSLVTVITILFSGYIQRNRNHVSAIPVGDIWELPIVHWINLPNHYQESAKPISVALKYIRGMYEIDPLDFSENIVDDQRIMLSDKISDLLAYVIPGTEEYTKVNQALERSYSAFKMYNDCDCVKRLLISDVMVDYAPLPVIKIEAVGRYVIFGTDGRAPLPAEDLGFKSVSLYLAKDIPLVGKTQESKDAVVVNGEGYYIVRSTIRTISKSELDDLRAIRKVTGMKSGL